MLIQFRVENHRSLRDEQVLSMVAAKVDEGDARFIRPADLGEALLPAVALYGANASGKSNVLGALGFMSDAVLRSHRLWDPEGGTPQDPFALSSKANEPSLYEVDIAVDGMRCRYGFVLSAARVEEEWLYAWPHGQKETWFEREGDAFAFGAHLHGENDVIRGLTRPNSLFLSAAAQNNHMMLLPVYGWFHPARFDLRGGRAARRLPLPRLGELFSGEKQRIQDAIGRLLQAADTGIVDIRVDKRDDPAGTSGGRRVSLYLRHKTDDEERSWLPLASESDGTITLLDIALDLVRILERGGLLCVDELEASLHPMVALELLRLFHDPKQNPQGAQLVFTTHDTNLLGDVCGNTPLRRDQVWFTEKDKDGATHLYPLSDFHPREEENLERGYLQGRYGAVPYLGRLVTTEDEG
jgi:uncharacterized protein